MAVKVIDGDLFTTDAKYICHQVNCQGKMGSGVARQIREKYPTVYRWYKARCAEGAREKERLGVSKAPLLGQVQMVYKEDYPVGKSDIDSQAICNLFSQDQYGYNGKRFTDYAAFEKCLLQLRKLVPAGETIAMPYKIGCGLGGGNWNVVYGIIEKILGPYYTVELWRKEG